jgi:hypothetical protein
MVESVANENHSSATLSSPVIMLAKPITSQSFPVPRRRSSFWAIASLTNDLILAAATLNRVDDHFGELIAGMQQTCARPHFVDCHLVEHHPP